MEYPIELQLAFLFKEYEFLESMLDEEMSGKEYLSRLNKDLKEISSKLVKTSDPAVLSLCLERGENTKTNTACSERS